MNKPSSALHFHLTGALFGAFIADALTMPVHWYYDTAAMASDYGWVRPLSPVPRSRRKHPEPENSLLEKEKYDQKLYLDKYVAFMTVPGKHKDTYVEAMHGEQVWPRRWMEGLAYPPTVFAQRLAARFKADA